MGLCGMLAPSTGLAVIANVTNTTLETSGSNGDGGGNNVYTGNIAATIDAITFVQNIGNSGSGAFTTFFRIQKNGVEEGYNSISQSQYDQKGGVTTADDHLNNFPISGNPYNGYRRGFEWLLDANETDSGTNEFLAVSEFVVFATWDPAATNDIEVGTGTLGGGDDSLIDDFTTGGAGANATLIYDLNSAWHANGSAERNYFILSDGISTGSGRADYIFYVPIDLFVGQVIDGNTITEANFDSVRVWLYMEIGEFNGTLALDNGGAGIGSSIDFGTSATFEEVAYAPSGTQTIPEAETHIALGALVLFGIGVTLHRRRQAGQAV